MQSLAQAGATAAHAHADALAGLLAPIPPAEFLERYLEREILHVARNDPGYFRAVYDVAEVESSILAGAFEHEKFLLVKSGSAPAAADEMLIERCSPRARHTAKPPKLVLDPRAILAHFDRGYTLVIRDAALFSLRLQKYVNRLQQRLGTYVQTNVYFTPPDSQGFDVHHDTHDTLVMQIEGTKTWRLYEPVVELPVESQPFSKDEHGKNLTLEREVELRPGDTLYIPHGVPHEGKSGGGRSLHVTLALLPLRAIDLLEAMLDVAATTDVELRRALPPGWHTAADFPQRFAALIGARLASAFAAGRVAPASELILRDLYSVSRAEAGGAFDELDRSLSASSGSTVALRDETPYLARRRGLSLELTVAGKTMRFASICAPLFERIERGPVSVAEVDTILPDGQGRAFVKLLLLEGLIRVTN